MQKSLPAVLLLLALSLNTVAYAAPDEDTETGNLSQDRIDSISVNPFDDNASSTTKNEATAISARGTYNYPSTASNTDTIGAVKIGAVASSRGECGVRVDNPHPSYRNSEEIHTDITSFCKVLPLASNTVSGKTYRSRWYGWQHQATLSPRTVYIPNNSPKVVQNHLRTIVAKCKEGNWYRYRTEGFGTVVTAQGQSLSASAYEENDDEIRCEKR